MMPNKTFQVAIERDEDGVYVASVPELPGCHTQGDTLAEVKENIKEAIEAYLESMGKEELLKTEFIGIHPIKVAVHA